MTTTSGVGLPGTSVVIASRNRPEMLAASVAAILDNDIQADELIIVDQSDVPHPGLAAVQRGDCVVKYVFPGTVGLCRANNHAVREAAHELVLFTHDDVLVAREWIATLAKAHAAASSRVVVTGRVASTDPETPGAFAPALKDQQTAASYVGRVGHDVLTPMNMALTRTMLADVGGFDERLGPGTVFPGAEDADLGLRLLEAGYRVEYEPDAVVHHRAWRSSDMYLSLRWGYGRAYGAFYAKHFSLRDPFVLGRMARDVWRRARRFPRRLLREGSRAFGDPVFVAAMAVGAASWYRRYGRRPAQGRPV